MKIYPNVGILFCRQKCFSTNTIVSLLHEALNFLIIIFHFTAVVPLIPGQSRTSTSSSAPICGDYFKLQSARYEEYINDISSVRTQNSDDTEQCSMFWRSKPWFLALVARCAMCAPKIILSQDLPSNKPKETDGRSVQWILLTKYSYPAYSIISI